MDRSVPFNPIVEVRSVSVPMLLGTITTTAALMTVGILWAVTGLSLSSLVIAMVGVGAASTLVLLTTMPMQCAISPDRRRSIPCRLQSRRWMVDAIAATLAAMVIANLTTTIV